MSITLTQTKTYHCEREGCEGTFTEQTSVEGSYCSQRCANLVAGENLLAHIQRDHRFCHACFRQLKEIERPPAKREIVIGPVDHDAVAPTYRNCLIGFEYLTEHAELGERSRDFVDHGEEHRPDATDAVITGTVCTCGTTDHRDAFLRLDEVVSITDAATRLCRILTVLGTEGQHDKTIDVASLLTALEAQADGETLDWQLALGHAIED